MNQIALHKHVVKLIDGENEMNWAHGFLTYIQFENKEEAGNYGKNLVKVGLATECLLRSAKRFDSGYELKIRGLSEKDLKKLVFEFESADWMDQVFWEVRDRQDLMQVDDTAWAA